MRSPEHAAPQRQEPQREPHIVSLETMEEQMQLQMRLALVLHQAGHLEYSAALNPAQPEAVDAEVRNAAMKAWIAEYAADFRTWLEQRDSHTRVNMDDYQRLLAIVQEIHAIQTERLGTERPPTIH